MAVCQARSWYRSLTRPTFFFFHHWHQRGSTRTALQHDMPNAYMYVCLVGCSCMYLYSKPLAPQNTTRPNKAATMLGNP